MIERHLGPAPRVTICKSGDKSCLAAAKPAISTQQINFLITILTCYFQICGRHSRREY